MGTQAETTIKIEDTIKLKIQNSEVICSRREGIMLSLPIDANI